MYVVKCLYWMCQGILYIFEWLFFNGWVIELIGNLMFGGGFVMSFIDIIVYCEVEQGFKGVNELLEQWVQECIQEFLQLNQEFSEVKSNVEVVNQLKICFFVVVSYDLMQLLNVVWLFFVVFVYQDVLFGEVCDLVQYFDLLLCFVEDLIIDLLDILCLESGWVSVECNLFLLNNFYDVFGVEFKVLVQEQGLYFCLCGSQLWVDSDIKLLWCILQNFLINVFCYVKGYVLFGVCCEDGYLCLEVWDQGLGILLDKQKVIFEEFKCLDSYQICVEKGFGFGLVIVDWFCKVFGYLLEVCFWLGKGSVFSVCVLLVWQVLLVLVNGYKVELVQVLNGVQVFCVDNEDSIFVGMNSLFSCWGCQVWIVCSCEECVMLLDSEMCL